MKFYKWERFKDIVAVTTLRTDGSSSFPYATNNLAFHVGDDEEHVRANREKTFKALKIKANKIALTYQSHSDVTLEVKLKDGGRGFHAFEDGIVADALYTKEKNLFLGVYHADCVPVFVYAPESKIVGVIHAGEEGSIKNITGKFLETLIKKEKVDPQKVYALIGPSLSFSYRIITEEQAIEYANLGGDIARAIKATSGKYFIDLPLLNFLQLRRLGVPVQNIDLSDECTYMQDDIYFSYAKAKTTGRNLSLIKLS
ncbi:MAG TPA: peptidoglycan editing factor PgeF [Bacilli bacterium]|nr:peptidoglycan editing factor PgeF [Bacilli bacterium]